MAKRARRANKMHKDSTNTAIAVFVICTVAIGILSTIGAELIYALIATIG